MSLSSKKSKSNRSIDLLTDETRGLWLGFLGVIMFAITLPMTRLAVGPDDAPQLDPVFVTFGRAAIAGVLSLIYLAAHRAPRPSREHWGPLLVCALGTVVGFPLFLGFALRYVHATHAAVITGLLPLMTAAIAALYFRQRPSAGFWACAIGGCILVLAYAAIQSAGQVTGADVLLLIAIFWMALGYLGGARVSTDMPAPHVISWVLVLSLPLTVPVALATLPEVPIRWQSWTALVYLAVFSMWLSFFAWYRGLMLGGVVRVSQVQLIQPFLALLFAVPILGESLDALTVVFALAVIAIVFISKKMPVTQ